MNDTALLILCFVLPCSMTALGATLIMFFNKISKLATMLTIGLAAGIMLSASIWSLLVPALENAQEGWADLSFIPVAGGFVLGGIFMVLLDFLSAKCFKTQGKDKEKAFKMFTAITIHNIPEGLSVGFAIGTAIATQNAVFGALMFAVGIAIQNFPEGLATALPMYQTLKSRKKAWLLGVISGIVEPIFAVIGFFLASSITSLLPWLLAFSGGAMIYVIVEEMIPEIHDESNHSWGTWAFVIGFVIMMLLDICL